VRPGRHNSGMSVGNSMQQDNKVPNLSADEAAKLANRLKARRRTSSKRTLQPSVQTVVTRHRVHKPWSPVRVDSSGSQNIDDVITVLSDEMRSVRQLPQNSSYARHRLRLLTTALGVAEGRR
jgi:hypothetical protein